MEAAGSVLDVGQDVSGLLPGDRVAYLGPLPGLPGPTLRTALRDTQQLTASTVSGQRGAGHLMIGMIRTLAADPAPARGCAIPH